jgi:MinD superfamily P-loop ATPase
MRQLVILSGKGGTGKTTVASALIRLSGARACADCDVDAPNLHLVNRHYSSGETAPYWGLPLADIDPVLCTACGECEVNCPFGAIIPGAPHRVDPYACEGCGVCVLVCPTDAINMRPHEAGTMTLYAQENRVFSTAQLRTGAGTSGLLVSQVKKRMNEAMKEDIPLAIVDGSPGIGCPVIATLSGADVTLIVAEPSLSGISDLERIVKTARGFGVRIAVCVNKANINPEKAEQIRRYCERETLFFAGVIPYDPLAIEAVNRGQTIADTPCPSGKAVREIYRNILPLLERGQTGV